MSGSRVFCDLLDRQLCFWCLSALACSIPLAAITTYGNLAHTEGIFALELVYDILLSSTVGGYL